MCRRDADLPPPSSRRGDRVGYSFATEAALVRHERWPFEEARRLVSEWSRYVSSRQRNGKTPLSTAQHISRFERLRLARPPARDPDGAFSDALAQHASELRAQGRLEEAAAVLEQARISRDHSAPRKRFSQDHSAPRKRSAARYELDGRLTRSRGPRAGAGETRVSAQGIPYKRCGHGTRLQALLFPRERYTPRQAEAWARAHDFAVRKVEPGPNWTRIQIVPSKLFDKGSFRNIEISERHGVRGVIGCPRVEIAGRSSRRGVPSFTEHERRLGRVSIQERERERRRRAA